MLLVKVFASEYTKTIIDEDVMQKRLREIKTDNKNEIRTYGFINTLYNDYFKAKNGYMVDP